METMRKNIISKSWNIKRESKDKIMNNRNKLLIDLVGKIEGYVLNGTTKKDKKREYMFVRVRGCSVIDYVIVSDNIIAIVL